MLFLVTFFFAVVGMAIVEAGGKIVVIGGYNDATAVSNVDSLNVETGTWSSLPSLETPAFGMAAVVGSDSKIYVTGGLTKKKIVQQVMMFDFASNKWSQTGTLSASEHATFIVQDNIYVVGGSGTDGGYRKVLESKDNGKTWTEKSSSFTIHANSQGTLYGNSFFICGEGYNPSKHCEKYNIAANKWTMETPMKKYRQGLSLVTIGSYIYAVGGAAGNNEKYDPKTKTWTEIEAMKETRYLAAVTTDGTKIYAIGGRSSDYGTAISSVEVYDPSKNRWDSSFDALPVARDAMGVVFIGESCDPEEPECGSK